MLSLKEIVQNILKSDEYQLALKELIDECFGYANGNGVVDFSSSFDLDSLIPELSDEDKEDLINLFQKEIEEDEGIYYNPQENILIRSTTDNVLVDLYEKKIYFEEDTITLSSEVNDLQIYLEVKKYQEESGVYGGVYDLGAYGDVSHLNFPEEYDEIDKETREMLLDIFKVSKLLNETRVTLDDLPTTFRSYIPKDILQYEEDHLIDFDIYDFVISIKDITINLTVSPWDAENKDMCEAVNTFLKDPLLCEVGTENKYGETYCTLRIPLEGNATSYLNNLV